MVGVGEALAVLGGRFAGELLEAAGEGIGVGETELVGDLLVAEVGGGHELGGLGDDALGAVAGGGDAGGLLEALAEGGVGEPQLAGDGG